jgi:pimeloyl-ACP methyl ester carboxylesterase
LIVNGWTLLFDATQRSHYVGAMAKIVLVHGLWADGSSWSGVIAELVGHGHEVTAAQLPLSSFDDDVAAVRRAIARIDGDCVLAGHSYGGVVIGAAAADESSVKALAYIAAYALDVGEDANGINATYPPASQGAAIRATDDGHLWLDVELFADAFAADVDPAVAAVMARTQGPASFACLGPVTTEPAWKDLPSWYLVAGDDRTISPDAQRWMADRMGASVTEVPSSHAVLVAHPAVTATLIEAAAATV